MIPEDYKVGAVVEVIGPALYMPYTGLFKIVGRVGLEDPDGTFNEEWISVTYLGNPFHFGRYYFKYNYLYIVPPDELTFKLIKYLDK